jgi:trigger factor
MTLLDLRLPAILRRVDGPGVDAKRKIPPAIRREVRQRCGFGCVICGLPLYEYEHMLGWANVQRHVAAEITLLCDKHHREKTGGLLPLAAVQAADQDPHNLRSGMSAPYSLHFSGDVCNALIGSNEMSASTGSDFVAVMIDGVPLVGFRFEDGHYLLNVLLFDATNELVLQIADNELVYSSGPWDVEFVSTRLVLRAAAREIFVDMVFEPPNRVRLERGRLLFNGMELLLRPDFVLVVNNAGLIMGNSLSGFPVGLNLGSDTRLLPSAIRVAGIPRYGVDRDASLQWARQQVAQVSDDNLRDPLA